MRRLELWLRSTVAEIGKPAARRRPVARYPAPPTPGDRWSAARALLRTPEGVLLPLRLFFGCTFTFAGLQKLADPNFFRSSNPASIQGQLALFRHSSPIGGLLGPVGDHPVLFGVVTALGEIAVGLGTLLGFWTRLAALGGAALSLSFWLTVSWHTKPFYYGSDIGFLVGWITLCAAGPGDRLSVDGGLRRRAARDVGLAPGLTAADRAALPAGPRAQLDRRTVLRGTAVAGGMAAASAAIAGADAVIGHGLAPAERPAARAGGGATHSPSTSAGAPSGTPGPVLAASALVPVGGALAATDPTNRAPVVLLQLQRGTFTALSAVCTHAGCTVSFDDSSKTLVCPCHGSTFDPATGAVRTGPASSPLPQLPVVVAGGQIRAQA